MAIALYRGFTRFQPDDRAVALTFGNFDGLHLGHQQLIRELQNWKPPKGRTVRPVVLSFYPHPAVVLGKTPKLPSITTVRQDLAILSSLGVDSLVLLHFTRELSELSPQDFAQQILFGALDAKHITLGGDARFGKGGCGTPDLLGEIGSTLGVGIEVSQFVEQGGAKISSRSIRAAVAAGAVEEAAQMLGRPFCYQGRVVKGDGRGSGIGIPTANLHPTDQIRPGRGVYSCRVRYGGVEYRAATNIGVRPTFGKNLETVETHLVNYSGGPLYGERLEIEFLRRLRGELKFDTVAALVTQIKRDIAEASAL